MARTPKLTIIDEGDSRKYWSQIPNIVCDLGLPSQALALYLQIKRVAGESGKCYKSTRTLALALKVSTGTVVRAKILLEQAWPQLGNKPLIQTTERPNPKGGKPYHEIRVTDIWRANMETFASATIALEDQVPEFAEQVPKPSKPSAIIEHKKNSLKKNGKEEHRTPNGVTLFHDIAGHYPQRTFYAVVSTAFGISPDEAFARDCYREWCERGYNPRSLKWLTDWFVDGAIPSRNGHSAHNVSRIQDSLDYLGSLQKTS